MVNMPSSNRKIRKGKSLAKTEQTIIKCAKKTKFMMFHSHQKQIKDLNVCIHNTITSKNNQ